MASPPEVLEKPKVKRGGVGPGGPYDENTTWPSWKPLNPPGVYRIDALREAGDSPFSVKLILGDSSE